jgi:ABC-type multidrug transport system fused ATPase/permease subunit
MAGDGGTPVLEPDRIKLFEGLSPLAKLTFTWTEGVLGKARHDVLSTEDLGAPPEWVRTVHSTDRFLYFWGRAKKEGRSWAWAIFRFFQRDMLKSTMVSMTSDVLLWAQAPLFDTLVKGMGRYQGGDVGQLWWLYGYAALIFIIFMTRMIMINYCNAMVFDMSYITRAAIMGAIYRRALGFASGPRQKYMGGRGINVITADANRICTTVTLANFAWIIPVRIIVAGCLAYKYLGVYSLPAMLFILLVIPTLYVMARLLKTRRTRLATAIDNRMGLTQESLQSIRVVKYLALEKYCTDRIDLVRNEELKLLFSANTLLALAGAIDFWAPIFAATLAIATLAFFKHSLEPGVIFAFIQIMASLTIPLWVLPLLIGGLVTSKVAVKRIDALLQADRATDEQTNDCMKEDSAMIRIDNADFQWDAPPPDPKKKKRSSKNRIASIIEERRLFSLDNISLRIPRGALVAIIGKTGAGKTSLLSAMIGEMRIRTGVRQLNGSVGLCQQNVWLLAGTFRENILFGLPYDEAHYKSVVKQCALEPDLARFAAGDQTAIGEKGTTVSGGQRQRIGLARIAYARPEVALLDDPLSAVDANVGRSLFFDCIKNGALRDSTRIFTTHHAGFLSECDLIVAMDEGRIVAIGTFKELATSDAPGHAKTRELLSRSPVQPQEDTAPSFQCNEEATSMSAADSTLQYSEEISRNAGRKAVCSYLRAFGGWWAVFLLAFLALLTEACKVAREYFLKRQMKLDPVQNENPVEFSIIYASLGTLQGLLSAAVAVLAVWLCKRAAKRIHKECLVRVMSAKLSVYDTTPIGRILNRFGRDLDSIDSNFPDRVTQLLTCMSALISAILLIGVYYPKVLPTIIVPLLATMWVQQKFRRAWRQLQQITGITLGPIISHFSESLCGLTVIRAFRQQEHFIARFDKLNDLYTYSAIWLMSARRWASLRTEAVWITYLLALSWICIWLNVPPEVTGLVLMYVMHTVESVDWSMRHLAELESCFVSVDRLHQYVMGLESESEAVVTSDPENWPVEGRVEFEKVSVKYKPTLPAVISNFSFTFEPKRRVAIVGRSGAGKSTIITALFRFTDPSEGVIRIDGVDISSVSLKRLRQSLAMVPQDPVLFSGTLRSNLDPAGHYSDEKLWAALDSVKMRYAVQEHYKKLDMIIDEAGAGFSIGQRQLLCLARAVLRGARIIVMDEATSNLDRETECLMQISLDETFRGATVITIAHRLETIMDYDIVIVMGKGKILETGPPCDLAKKGGEFSRMLKAASIGIGGK